MAVNLIVDGMDPDTFKSIINNFILSGNYNSYEKLNTCIILNGLSLIQAGENVMLIQLKLASMLGENIFVREFSKMMSFENQAKKFNDMLDGLEISKPDTLYECQKFEALFLGIDDISIQTVLRNINNEDCIVALCGCNYRGIKKILNNLSFRLAQLILNDIIINNNSKQDIIDAQEKILMQVKEVNIIYDRI